MRPDVPGRWHAQALDGPRFGSGLDVVRHLGAVQSQLHDMALWAVGRRCGRTLHELQAEFDAGAFCRTHVLRPTWHFVDPDDLHWLQALTAERVGRLDAQQRRQHGLDDALLRRCEEVAVDALAAGPLTRPELGAALRAGGADVADRAMAHVAMHLEINGLVTSGPMRGKQHTYRLADVAGPVPDRDHLLARVAQRYGRGHGAFRARDLAWWTSLTLTDARRAIELADLPLVQIDGEDHAVPAEAVTAEPPAATLLSNFDEYISYARDPRDLDRFDGTIDDIMRGAGLLLVDGRLAGRWARTVQSRTVTIEVRCSPPVTTRIRRALEAEAQAFGDFLAREPRLVVST